MPISHLLANQCDVLRSLSDKVLIPFYSEVVVKLMTLGKMQIPGHRQNPTHVYQEPTELSTEPRVP
jgi:hypothetical protein